MGKTIIFLVNYGSDDRLGIGFKLIPGATETHKKIFWFFPVAKAERKTIIVFFNLSIEGLTVHE
jgi:hypothetical protein